jgi:RND family efflux transporter MFP subunit
MSQERHSSLDLHDFHLNDADGGGLNRHRVLRRAGWLVLLVLVLLGLGAARTVMGRNEQQRVTAAITSDQGRIHVVTTLPTRSTRGQQLILPGTLQGMVESPIYARAAGYVLRWHRDIGAAVRRGELLAEIDTPEIDQQLEAALASRDQAAASLELARISARRWEVLRQRDAVSQQEFDERRSNLVQNEANLAVAEANLRRLREQQAFKRIVAPFDGVITRRNVNVGDLADAGNGGVAKSLFTLAQVDTLRLYVYVPQTYSQRIQVGDTVDIQLQELPDQRFKGRVVRTARAIDPSTRTLQVEINTGNADQRLLPGSYVQVAFPGTRSEALVVPTNTLMFRAEGPRAAVAGPDDTAVLKPVVIGENYGRSIQIVSGLEETDRLIVNPPDSLQAGDRLTARDMPKRPAGQGGAGGAGGAGGSPGAGGSVSGPVSGGSAR